MIDMSPTADADLHEVVFSIFGKKLKASVPKKYRYVQGLDLDSDAPRIVCWNARDRSDAEAFPMRVVNQT